MISDRRVANLRRRLVGEKSHAFLITAVSNVRYLTGFEDVFDDAANVALLLTPEISRVYTDSRYSEAAIAAALGTPWVVRVPEDSLYVELCEELVSEGIDSLAMESSVPYGRFKFISEKFGGKVQVTDQWIEDIRQVKEAAEIERIAAAAAITDRAFDHILATLRPGMRECDIALELEIFMRRSGSTGIAFSPIVASGPNSSRPHASVSEREIEPGDFLTMDFGARVGGYCSDLTRTVVVGRASDRQRSIYAAVLEANEAGIKAARAGLPGVEIDAAARAVLGREKLSPHFTHGLGHGVGLDVHELPSVSPRGRDSVLSGSVITIEPGVYIEGFGGVRIEDLVVVEDGGSRLLSHSPKELIEVI